MPELPEVETIKNQIQQYLPEDIIGLGHSTHTLSFMKKRIAPKLQEQSLNIHEKLSTLNRVISSSEINKNSNNLNLSSTHFTLTSINRYAKQLFFHIQLQQPIVNKSLKKSFEEVGNHLVLVSHLGMSGAWIKADKNYEEKHLHFSIHLKNYSLHYVDPRRFGHFYWIPWSQLDEHLKTLAPDVSSSDFNLKYLKMLQTQKKFQRKIIKPFLLDQSVFPGIGNYMASEICARSHILPTSLFADLTSEQLKSILQSTKEVIAEQTFSGGNTFQGGYRDLSGGNGGGLKSLMVFFQKNCGKCHTLIIKTQLQGRGTFHCPQCQG